MLSATFIEARKITDKRHGYRGLVSLNELGNGSEKARIKLAPDLGWLALPDGFGRPIKPDRNLIRSLHRKQANDKIRRTELG